MVIALKIFGKFSTFSMLCSCGDDGHLRGWNWKELLNSVIHGDMQGNECMIELTFSTFRTELMQL